MHLLTLLVSLLSSSSPPRSASFLSMISTKKLVYGKDDALFGCIEQEQGSKPFGDLLDAGTGIHSLRWIATLMGNEKGMTSFTAITADVNMQRNVQQEADHLGISEGNHVMIGNWFPDNDDKSMELPCQQYDTILADYLIGAMDGFSPYRQDEMIPKLTALLKPGGKFYLVGLEPIPDRVDGPGDVICRVRQVRDACILLAGHRCYREYPVKWIEKQIKSMPELTFLSTDQFPILYRYNTIVRQINVGRSKFTLFAQPALADSMKLVLDGLDAEAKKVTDNGPVKLGFDYVVAVEKKAT